ncbi:hypothetical protein LJB85_04260, partial [Porphyromonadaceae bacterium OttesenSCG-928-L07]|nr:hypothetical protein [Porphyromonadaceae bacterium OttesenSCG-928-L07]
QPEPEQVYIQAPQPLEEIKLDYNYAIQVGAFRNPVPRVYFDQLQGVKVYKGYDNIYRYAVGEYPDEFLANRDAVAVRNMIRDAFVINVDRYVAEGKIRNGKEGDKIDDNELLLIRLRNFELEKQRKQGQTGASAPAAKRYIDKPWVKDEVSFAREGYTVVLMSVNKMLDMSMFSRIDVIDVYQIEDGTYNYCSDTYATITAANAYLQKMRRSGFKNAYIVKVDISGNLGKKEGKQEANKGLKDVLDKYSF